jgi:hypothetical protein
VVYFCAFESNKSLASRSKNHDRPTADKSLLESAVPAEQSEQNGGSLVHTVVESGGPGYLGGAASASVIGRYNVCISVVCLFVRC